MKLKLMLYAALALAAAGCQTPQVEKPVAPVEKAVPTPTACVSNQTPPPSGYPDTDAALKAAKNFAERYGLLARGRILRDQRLAEVEPLIQACRQP